MRDQTDVAVFIVVGLWVFMVGSLSAWSGARETTPRWRLWLGVAELTVAVEIFLLGLLFVTERWLARDVGVALLGSLVLISLYLRMRWLLRTAMGLRPEWQPVEAHWLGRECFWAAMVLLLAVSLRRWLPIWLGTWRMGR
jgi:hypothetical protein